MTKITIGVSRVYKNSGSFRFHRKKTKPSWKHYFLSDDYTDEYTFGTEWVDSITAKFLNLKKRYKRHFVCFDCSTIFYDYVKKSTKNVDCPFCEENS